MCCDCVLSLCAVSCVRRLAMPWPTCACRQRCNDFDINSTHHYAAGMACCRGEGGDVVCGTMTSTSIRPTLLRSRPPTPSPCVAQRRHHATRCFVRIGGLSALLRRLSAPRRAMCGQPYPGMTHPRDDPLSPSCSSHHSSRNRAHRHVVRRHGRIFTRTNWAAGLKPDPRWHPRRGDRPCRRWALGDDPGGGLGRSSRSCGPASNPPPLPASQTLPPQQKNPKKTKTDGTLWSSHVLEWGYSKLRHCCGPFFTPFVPLTTPLPPTRPRARVPAHSRARDILHTLLSAHALRVN